MIETMVMVVALQLPQQQPATARIGYSTSEYKGKWYAKKLEPIRKCIMFHESRYNYNASGGSSSAQGAYQFLDSQWRDSLVYMLLDEHGNRKEIKALRGKPIHSWSRYYQDRSFFTVFRHGAGAKHWSLQEQRCDLRSKR
jgi:hypothetical protein